MTPQAKRRPSAALVVAVIALVAAFAGSAVALPGKNTVDKNDIKKNAVKSKQVKADSLTGADIKEDTLALPATPDEAVTLRIENTNSGDPEIDQASATGFTVSDPDGAPAGNVRITAPFEVADCAAVATTNNVTSLSPDTSGVNALIASVAQFTSPGDRNTLEVEVEDNAGAGVEAGFSLALFC